MQGLRGPPCVYPYGAALLEYVEAKSFASNPGGVKEYPYSVYVRYTWTARARGSDPTTKLVFV